MAIRKNQSDGVAQERILWEVPESGRCISKVFLSDGSYQLRLDVRGKTSTGFRNVIEKIPTKEREEEYTFLLRLQQEIDRRIGACFEEDIAEFMVPQTA